MSDYGHDTRSIRRQGDLRTQQRYPDYATAKPIYRDQKQPSRGSMNRPRDREDGVKDIPRNFPADTEYRRTRYREEYDAPGPARYNRRRGHDDNDDRNSDSTTPAGYAATRARGSNRNRDDGSHSNRSDHSDDTEPDKSKVENTLENVGLGGVAALVGKGRSQIKGRMHGHRDSSSDSERSTRSGRGGPKKTAAVGGVVAVGKAIRNRVRSKSRRSGNRSHSGSSDDSYVPSRRHNYQGSHKQDSRRADGVDDDRVARPRGRNQEQNAAKRDDSANSLSSTEIEEKRKKIRTKELFTAGIATVATIRAAQGVYSSMVASENRHKLLKDGEISLQEARKRKTKNMLQDAAAVGIAGLSIKSAFGGWKDMNSQRTEMRELDTQRRKRKKTRQQRQSQQGNNPFGGSQANPYLTYVPVSMYPPRQITNGDPHAAMNNVPPPAMGAPSQRR